MFTDSTHQLTITKRKEVLDAIVHHREPPKVIHLDNVIEPAESREMKSSFNHQPESTDGFVSPHPITATGVIQQQELWKQQQHQLLAEVPLSVENHVDDDGGGGGGGGVGNTSASHDFYNMVLDILDTFHSAAEMEVRRTRKREFQRQAALDMLM